MSSIPVPLLRRLGVACYAHEARWLSSKYYSHDVIGDMPDTKPKEQLLWLLVEFNDGQKRDALTIWDAGLCMIMIARGNQRNRYLIRHEYAHYLYPPHAYVVRVLNAKFKELGFTPFLIYARDNNGNMDATEEIALLMEFYNADFDIWYKNALSQIGNKGFMFKYEIPYSRKKYHYQLSTLKNGQVIIDREEIATKIKLMKEYLEV